MKKRTIALMLSLIMLITAVIFTVVTAFSATYYQDGDWKYELPTANSQEYYIAGYTGELTKIRIPALFQGKPVVKISDNAFLNRTELTYIDIPATITAIGKNSFYGCTALESMEIPEKVAEIGVNAFYGCTGMKTLTFSKKSALTEIPRNAFNGCTSLTELSLPHSITKISDKAFLGCVSLQDVIIPPTVVEIGEKSFSGCTNMRILGWTHSYAQTYAEDHNIPFVSVGEFFPVIPTESTTTQSQPTQAPTTSTPATTDTVPYPTESTAPTGSTAPATTVPVSVPASSTAPTAVGPTFAPTGTDTQPTVPSSSVNPNVYYIGDSDLSGVVTVKDATLIQKHAADLVKLDRLQLFLANCDGAGGVNVKDATQIQKYCAGFKNILFVGTAVEF